MLRTLQVTQEVWRLILLAALPQHVAVSAAPLGQEDQGDPAPVPQGPLDSLTPFPRRGHPGPLLSIGEGHKEAEQASTWLPCVKGAVAKRLRDCMLRTLQVTKEVWRLILLASPP